MQYIVLGSGTTVPHPARSSSAYWLETAGGTLLLDCSASAIHRITQEGLDWANLDSIWISHFHMDHVGGLAPFLAGTKHAPQMKEREKPLRIFGGPGLRGLLDNFDAANNYKLFEQPFPLEVIEAGELEKFEIIPGLEAVAVSTPHTDESRAIRLQAASGETIVYTADTGFAKELGEFARDADLLVIEASYPKDKTQEKHLELSEAMYIIREAAPKRAVLTHLYQVWDEVDARSEIAKFEPGCEVMLAYDGLRLEV
jgi:ribonuclease BN (tRNA processing enzyme)